MYVVVVVDRTDMGIGAIADFVVVATDVAGAAYCQASLAPASHAITNHHTRLVACLHVKDKHG